MQTRKVMIGIGLILLIAAGAAVFFSGGGKGRSDQDPQTAAAAARSQERHKPQPSSAAGGPVVSPTDRQPMDAAEKARLEAARRQTLEALGDAATTYEAAQLPFINKYLYDKDPEIRKAAREAMLVLGDAGAGKLLRDAAQSAASEEEREALVKAADYAELPAVDYKQLKELRALQGAAVESPRTERKRSFGQRRPKEEGTAPAPPAPAPPTPPTAE